MQPLNTPILYLFVIISLQILKSFTCVGNCETTKKTIGVFPNITEKKKISWADVVRRKETKGENNDFLRDKIVRSKSGG